MHPRELVSADTSSLGCMVSVIVSGHALYLIDQSL